MVVNLVLLKEYISQQNLMNLKLFYLKKIIRHKMKRIQAKKHKIETYEIDKISLSCFDDKRQVLDDGVHTLAYFHKDSVTSCKKTTDDSTN